MHEAKHTPKKAKNKPLRHESAVVNVLPPRCPRCGSTERAYYDNTRTVAHRGTIAGQPYNRIVYRRTRCTACDQHRTERSFYFDPAAT